MGLNGEIDLTSDHHRLVVELIDRYLPATDGWPTASG